MASLLQGLVRKLYRRTPFYAHRQALVVQQNENRRDDVFFVEDLLRSHRYDISIIGVEECRKEHVLSSIDRLAHDSRDNSKTFLYYAGHGHHIDKTHANGLTVSGDEDVYSQRIAPSELFERLARVRGKKAVVIDACLSGEFVGELSGFQAELQFTDYVLITATTRDGFSLSAGILEAKDTPLEGRSISPLVYWIYTAGSGGRKIDLANMPLPTVTITDDSLRNLQTMYPEIDVERIDLRVQRVGNIDFIL